MSASSQGRDGPMGRPGHRSAVSPTSLKLIAVAFLASVLSVLSVPAAAPQADVIILSQPLHAGRISP
ncbi:MAG TPA: hypothetical protein VFC44_04150, partial [Candidatus Saccharimonadales bacterium]|nr:hypothetical protein [Candidatus Saccharimonadales bacterium]